MAADLNHSLEPSEQFLNIYSDVINSKPHHGVKKELCRRETRIETVFDESLCRRNLRVPFKVRQGSILETIRNAFTVQGLLTHAGNHLRDVDERTFRSRKKK